MNQATMDMTEGRSLRSIIIFALPLLISNIFQQLYSVADSVIVGRLIGVNGFAAIGAAGFFYWLALSITLGFSQGFGTLIAQRFGAKDDAGLKRAVAQSILLTVVFGTILTVLCITLARPILVLVNTPSDILDDACIYLNLSMSAILLSFAYNIAAAILRALGNSRTPLASIIIASVINIALDLVFVGILRMGVEGAAIATVIATFCSFLYCLLKLRRIALVRVQVSDFTDGWNGARELLRLGLPLALCNTVIGVGGLIVQYVINGFGTLFVAGAAAANKYLGVMCVIGFSLEGAVAVFVGQNCGAGRLDRIKQIMRTAQRIAFISSLVIAALTLVFGRGMIGLFISSNAAETEAIKQIGYNNLIAISACLPSLYLLLIHRSALQGMGNTVIPMFSGFMELALRIVSTLILPVWAGVWSVYFANGVAWTGSAILLILSYFTIYRRRKEIII